MTPTGDGVRVAATEGVIIVLSQPAYPMGGVPL